MSRQPRATGRHRRAPRAGESAPADLSVPARVQTRLAGGLNLLVGLWLVLSPWAVGYSQAEDARWNAVVVGVAVAALALARMVRPERLEPLGWANVALGLWLVVSAWVLRPVALADWTGLIWNNVVGGLLAAWLAASGTAAFRRSIRRPR